MKCHHLRHLIMHFNYDYVEQRYSIQNDNYFLKLKKNQSHWKSVGSYISIKQTSEPKWCFSTSEQFYLCLEFALRL